MYRILIVFDGVTTDLGGRYPSEADAREALGRWMHAHDCMSDKAFRIEPVQG